MTKYTASYRSVIPMGFQNLNTYYHAVKEGRVDEFHEKYEAAVKEVRGRLGKTYPMLIGGEEVTSSETFKNVSPSNRDEVVGIFQKGTKEHVDRAVKAAKAAQPEWEALGWEKRADILDKAADLMTERHAFFCALMALENGKPRVEASNDADEAVDFLRFYAHEMRRNKGYVTKMGQPFPDEECWSVLHAHGVFGIVSPFNFAVAITTGMTAAALVTGNSVVLKPASDTPWSAYEIVKLLWEAGVPKSALNFVTGGGATVGEAITHHPEVDGFCFTGSKAVGMKAFSEFVGFRPRPYIAEMGGKNAIIVNEDADLEKAVEGVYRSSFGYSGQKCSASSRVFVHESLYDAFMDRLVQETKKLKVGDPTEKDTFLGPVITQKKVQEFQDAVRKAKQDGGDVLTGGEVVTEGKFTKGNFVTPTVIADLELEHELFKTELFLPITTVQKFRDLDKVVDVVNSVEYGLTFGIFTESRETAEKVFDRVEAGVVYNNRTRGGSTGAVVGGNSFGGWKYSGTTGKHAGGVWYLPQFMKEQSRTFVHHDS